MGQLDAAGKELEQEITGVDKATDRLRVTFEQYFQGVERKPPNDQRDNIKRRVRTLHLAKVLNTELRFRINQIVAKFTTYETYWNRILKQMEDGTYHRDVFKAKYRSKQRDDAENVAGDESADAPPDKTNKAAKKRPRPATGLSDENVEAIYNAFVMAKRRCKQNIKGLTKEAMATSLKKQVPAIQKQYKCKTVEFKVVIKGGKAILKAVPKF